MRGNRRLVLAGVVLFLAAAAICSAVQRHRIDRKTMDYVFFLPEAKYLKPMILGFDNFVADLLLLETVQHFGEGGLWRTARKPDKWVRYFDTISDLTPRFRLVYRFGSQVLADSGKGMERNANRQEEEKSASPEKIAALLKQGEYLQRQAVKLLEKGDKISMEAGEKTYWFPHHISFLYLYNLGDGKEATRWAEEAAARPDAPDYVKRLPAHIPAYGASEVEEWQTKMDLYRLAVDHYDRQLALTLSKEERQLLVKRRADCIVDRDVDIYTHVIGLFEEERGRFPLSLEELADKGYLNDLIAGGYLEGVPEEPLGGIYIYSAEEGQMSSSTKEKEYIERLIVRLESATWDYKEELGEFPPDIRTLVDKGFFYAYPAPVFWYLDYDPETGKFSAQPKWRE